MVTRDETMVRFGNIINLVDKSLSESGILHFIFTNQPKTSDPQ